MRALTVLVPSRGRPHNIQQLLESWESTVTGDTHLIVIVDDDDPTLEEYLKLPVEVRVGPRLRIGGTLNVVAPEVATTSRNIGFMGDDHRPRTKGWDETFINELDKLKVGVVYGNDLAHGVNLATSVTMTSNIVSTLGYMCVPGSIHLFLDNFWMELGRGTNITYFDDVVVEHVHPHFQKALLDNTYVEANSPEVWGADETTFNNYVATQLQDDLQKLRTLK
jgi:glycosyltransferase involved in cell wall biosynthesis